MMDVRADDIQFIETPGGNFGSGIATPSRGAVEVSVIRQRQRPGGVNPSHTHDREEVMILLAGEVVVTLQEEALNLGPGDAVIVPSGTIHRVENCGSVSAEWLLVAPAGVRFFHANGDEAAPPWSL